MVSIGRIGAWMAGYHPPRQFRAGGPPVRRVAASRAGPVPRKNARRGPLVPLSVVPAILLLWLGVGFFLLQKYNAAMAGAEQDAMNLARVFEENIHRTIEAIDITIRAVRVARSADPAHFDLGKWERDSGLTRDPTLRLSFADRDGSIVLSNLAGLQANRTMIDDRDHFRIPRDTPGDVLFISRPVRGRVSNRWSVQFVRKVYDAGGGFDGVIVASLDPGFLSRFYTSLTIGRGALILSGGDGIVRSSAPESVAPLTADLSASPLMAGASAASQGAVRMDGTADRLDRVFAWRRVDPYGLIAVVGLSSADVLEEYRRDLYSGIIAGLILSILTAAAGAVLARHRRDVTMSREMLRVAVDNIGQGLIVVDAQRQVPVMNGRAAELLGLPRHLTFPGVELDSLLEWQLGSGEFSAPESADVRRLAESGGIEGGTSVYRRTRRDGTVLEVRTKVVDTGLAVRTYTDITEQEHAARDLAAARDAAEAAARARSEFLAVMSHEIRTPLNGVIGVAGLLEGMDLGPAQRDYVQVIRQSGDHLLQLINDILDFSRLEAQRVDLEDAVFDPRALMRGVVGMFMTQAAGKGLRLTGFAADGMPEAVGGDPGRLRQILLNLIGNAVKFTDRGWIALTMAHEPDGDGRVRLRFSVADSGIGIIPEAIERMFQEFTQMDGSISRRFGGSGLGLAICRRLVELMGGTIAVESKPGLGSTFRFDVPLRLAASQNQPGTAVAPPEPAADAPLRILLAEDNATNRLVALAMLGQLGHRADVAGNGLDVLDALRSEQYDLVLMDVMMPEMDGIAATREIRRREADGMHLPIVGLTAGSSADALAACLGAGMDAVTTKPVTLVRLRAAIAEGLEAAGRQAGPALSETPAAASRLRELADMLGEDAVAELLETFAEDTDLNIGRMEDAVARNDASAIHRIAHSVAGAARNMGADILAERASGLETDAGVLAPERIHGEIAALRRALEDALQAMGTSGIRAGAS